MFYQLVHINYLIYIKLKEINPSLMKRCIKFNPAKQRKEFSEVRQCRVVYIVEYQQHQLMSDQV